MAIKGYKGAVNGVGSIIRWVVDQRASPNPAPSSATLNMANEVEGTLDWVGQYTAHGHTPGSDPGDALSFVGTLDKDTDTNETLEGTAMVERWRVDWNYATNAPIIHTVDFGANGTMLSSGSTDVSDSTDPAIFMSNDPTVKVKIGTLAASPVYSELCGVEAASLYCWGEVRPYVDSCSNNIHKRAMGHLGWMVDLAVNIEATDAMESLNGFKPVQLFVTNTANWEVKYVCWKRVGPLDIQVQGRKLVTVQYRGIGAGIVDISGTWTTGALTNPASTDVWPYA